MTHKIAAILDRLTSKGNPRYRLNGPVLLSLRGEREQTLYLNPAVLGTPVPTVLVLTIELPAEQPLKESA